MESTNDEFKKVFNRCCLPMIRSYYRLWSMFLVLVTLAVLIMSFYFEYARGLNPCPLCLMQRFCVMLLLFLAGLSFYFKRSASAKKILMLQMVIASAGIFFAIRQLWLQSLPVEHTPVCLPGLGMMIHYLPWSEVAHALLLGAGDCAEITWTWLGLSMPAWSALYFLGMLLASLFCYTHLRKIVYPFNKNSYL